MDLEITLKASFQLDLARYKNVTQLILHSLHCKNMELIKFPRNLKLLNYSARHKKIELENLQTSGRFPDTLEWVLMQCFLNYRYFDMRKSSKLEEGMI